MSPLDEESIEEAYTRDDGEVQLVGTQCSECDEYSFPPRPWCPNCGASESTAMTFDQIATLESYSVVHVPQEGFEAPYVSGFVRLQPGNIRVFGLITGSEDKLAVSTEVLVTMLSTEDTASPTETWGFKLPETEASA